MSSNIKSNFSRCQNFHFPIKEVKNKNKQLRCGNTSLKIYRLTYTLRRSPPPLVRFSTFLEYSLSPSPSERTYFLNGPKNLSIFYKHNIRLNVGKWQSFFYPKSQSFFYVTALSLFLDTTGKSLFTFSNITLFQKCNKTKPMILISLLHKT